MFYSRFYLFFVFILLVFTNSKASIFLQKLTFECDINFESSEFLYLTDLKENTFITDNDIQTAKENLYQKGRFTKIEILEKPLENGKHVHFILNSGWVLKKVVLQGVLFGKHNYLSLYKQNPGYIFNVLLHEKNIKEIKEFLEDKGYFNSFVSDELIYNKKDKSIVVKISINKKRRFSINSLSFNIIEENKFYSSEKKSLINDLKNKIKLNKKVYSKKLIYKYLQKIKKYLLAKGFVDCRVSFTKDLIRDESKLNLIFNLYLVKKQKLEFKGNSLFSDKEIKKEILGIDYPAWFFTPEIIAHELFEEYYKKGYWNSVIYYKKLGKYSFLFDIKENKPVYINNIIIKDEHGNEKKEPLIFFNNVKNKIFEENLIDDSINKLIQYYLKKGFWDFHIANKEFVKNSNDIDCKIIITIKKGKQRFWGNLKIRGFEYLERENYIFNQIVFNKSKPFNFYLLQKQKLYLLKYFQQKGYWYVDVFPTLEEKFISKDKIKVFVNWNIELGPKIKFGKVFLKGDTSLSFKRILNELTFKEGEIWDRGKINLTIKNLKKLDVFKKLSIEPDQQAISQKSGKVPIKMTLIDDDPVQIALRLGYFLTNKNFLFKRASTFKLGGSLILKNPTNQVDKLTLNMDFTRFERKLDLDYKILSPFGLKFKKSRLIGKFKAYSNKYINPVQVRQSCSAYEAIENGFFIGLNNEYKKDYFWRLNLGNEWIRTSKVRGNLNFDQSYINKTLPYFFINPSFVVEKIDNKLDIKRGSISFFSLKFMIPEYISKPTNKLMFEQSIFKPIYKDTLIAARVRLGYILNSEFNQIQPSQRFFLGGPYSVRGYEKDAIPPYGTQIINGKKEYTIQGGSGMINANLELRFPLYKSLRGVLFQDIGALSQTGFAGFKGKWFPSSGFGFRYKTPIGPIRFDIGFKWKHLLPNDTSYAWYLTLGEVF
ncbi:BamA/TamA family outer membrane protein [Candidatus Dependentiae bacterium]|nr:BamA/TamA family outer membrane protein [Candidatus Dependentiae bacterium]